MMDPLTGRRLRPRAVLASANHCGQWARQGWQSSRSRRKTASGILVAAIAMLAEASYGYYSTKHWRSLRGRHSSATAGAARSAGAGGKPR